MPFLPKSRERYFAALRNYIHLSVNRSGISLRHCELYRKIILAEIFCLERKTEPADIIRITDSVLGAAVILLLRKGIWLSTELGGNGTYMLDIKNYTALLLEICRGCKTDGCKITVTIKESEVFVVSEGGECTKTLDLLAQRIGAVLFKLTDEKKAALKIALTETDSPPVSFREDWQLVTDRLSEARVFLC